MVFNATKSQTMTVRNTLEIAAVTFKACNPARPMYHLGLRINVSLCPTFLRMAVCHLVMFFILIPSLYNKYLSERVVRIKV